MRTMSDVCARHRRRRIHRLSPGGAPRRRRPQGRLPGRLRSLLPGRGQAETTSARRWRPVTSPLREADIRDTELCGASSGKRRSRRVVHLAARPGVRPSLEDAATYLDINVNGTLNLLNVCREFGVPRFVFASSSSVYGQIDTPAAHEDSTPCRPLSPYGASKVAARGALLRVRQRLRRHDDRSQVLHRVRPAPAAGHGHLPLHPAHGRRRGDPHIRRWQQSAVTTPSSPIR